jgi:DNA-binding protein Fis
MPEPKLIVVVNNPLLTMVALFVTGPPKALAPLLTVNRENFRSKLPPARFAPSLSRP